MKQAVIVVTFLWGLAMAPGFVRADESLGRAATSALPAALAGAGLSRDQVVSAAEARQVRAGYVPTFGAMFYVVGAGKYADSATINYAFVGGGQTATFAFTPAGLVFVTQGTAVIGSAPPVQGVLGANTNVFTGVVGIQAATSGLQVVARPDLFLVRVQ